MTRPVIFSCFAILTGLLPSRASAQADPSEPPREGATPAPDDPSDPSQRRTPPAGNPAPQPPPSGSAPPQPQYPYPPPQYPPQYPHPQYPPPQYPPSHYPPPQYPPPQYPQPQYGPPKPEPTAEPLPRYPDDAAARATPFLGMLVGSEYFAERFSAPLNAGAEFGVFIAGRLRLAARAILPLVDAYDAASHDDVLGGQFIPLDSKPPTLIWGGGVGFAAVATESLAISPSIYVLASDIADYGVVAGIAFPFEWVNRSGFRIGFDFGLVRGFGGEVFGQCEPFFGGVEPCDSGEIRAFDRNAGSGFFSHFYFGWAFSTAKPY